MTDGFRPVNLIVATVQILDGKEHEVTVLLIKPDQRKNDVEISIRMLSLTFSWGDHTLHFVLLSPVVAMMAITGGELAILKGTRRLKSLAVISVYGVIGALITSIPLFYIWGESAIVPSIALVALLQMVLTCSYSFRLFPAFFAMRFSRIKLLLGEGLGMVRLGIAFILAGILGIWWLILRGKRLNNSI